MFKSKADALSVLYVPTAGEVLPWFRHAILLQQIIGLTLGLFGMTLFAEPLFGMFFFGIMIYAGWRYLRHPMRRPAKAFIRTQVPSIKAWYSMAQYGMFAFGMYLVMCCAVLVQNPAKLGTLWVPLILFGGAGFAGKWWVCRYLIRHL